MTDTITTSQHLRPRFHIRPDVGFVNDPNGPILIDGTVHLFFQYRSPMNQTALVLWGHATSTDFVRWTLHRPSLSPHPTADDREGCWSGNTVSAGQTVRAFYSGYRSDRPLQSVHTATSTDGGFSFGPPEAAMPDPHPDERVTTFRDPFAWRQDDTWWMVVGAGTGDGIASARLYRSDDLTAWTYEGPLAAAPRTVQNGTDSGEMWECPQVLRVGHEDVLLVGSWTMADGIGEALSVRGATVGREAGRLRVRRLDAGPNLYAASGLRDSPFGPVMWGWTTEGRDQDAIERDGWSGSVSLPRRLRLGDDGTLLSDPLPTTVQLREAEIDPIAGLGAQLELMIQPVGPSDVVLEFSQDERLLIRLDIDNDRVEVDRSAASTDQAAHGGVTIIERAFGSSAPKIRVFVDGSVVEVFTSGGRVATLRVYPTAPPPWRIATSGQTKIRVWRLAGG